MTINGIHGHCPQVCDCKWKNGKESVSCLNTNLTKIPSKLDTSTQVLDFTGNNVTHLNNDEFFSAGLLNLQKIFLVQCKLKTIDEQAFRSMKNLVELDLSHNYLSIIPTSTFDSINQLRELKLNGNPIVNILNNAFINLSELVRLELSNCKIHVIEVKAFVDLELSLEWLNIDGNRLNELDPKAITTLHTLKGLEMARNPWNCTCKLRKLFEWIVENKLPSTISPTCKYPIRISNKSWDRLTVDDFACAPRIENRNSVQYGVEGRNVTLKCRVTGVPQPRIKWLHKNKLITNLSISTYPAMQSRKVFLIRENEKGSNLTIITSDLQDTGSYLCMVENRAGSTQTNITLVVTKQPPENGKSLKLFIAILVLGIVLIFISIFAIICFYSYKKRKKFSVWNNMGKTENNYEKIEMNHKYTTAPGSTGNNFNMAQDQEEMSMIMMRNGDYKQIPTDPEDEYLQNDLNDESCSNASTVKQDSKHRAMGTGAGMNSATTPHWNIHKNENENENYARHNHQHHHQKNNSNNHNSNSNNVRSTVEDVDLHIPINDDNR